MDEILDILLDDSASGSDVELGDESDESDWEYESEDELTFVNNANDNIVPLQPKPINNITELTHATPTSSPESIDEPIEEAELTAKSKEITMDTSDDNPPLQSQSLQLSPQLFSSSESDDDEAPVLRRVGVPQRGGRGVRQRGDEIRQRGEVARGRVRGRVRPVSIQTNVLKSTTQYLIFQHNFVFYIIYISILVKTLCYFQVILFSLSLLLTFYIFHIFGCRD